VGNGALILGIESSCDETAAAVVRSGEELVSSVVASQIATHLPFGGVVPELASREHLRNLVPVTRAALAKAGLKYAEVDAIAVTNGPGLAGALLTGISFAKALAWALEKPLIAVNHIEGHIHAVLLEQRQQGVPGSFAAGAEQGGGTRPSTPTTGAPGTPLRFPVLALVVSGGHTHLFLAEQRGAGWYYENVGHTRDDAAGEAFDKVAKLLGLGYPGGPVIDRLARFGNPEAVRFTFAQLKHRARQEARRGGPIEPDRKRFDFSYSGIKTAVLRYVEVHHMEPAIEARRSALLKLASPSEDDHRRLCDPQTLDLVASFQAAMVADLTQRTLAACEEYGVESLLVTGGVAANSALRASFEQRAPQVGVQVHFPSRPMSTDNAAMIAAAAYPKWLARDFASLNLTAQANLPLR
jgi:tRNA N6-adenosine threonylcarbamoyltransferase